LSQSPHLRAGLVSAAGSGSGRSGWLSHRPRSAGDELRHHKWHQQPRFRQRPRVVRPRDEYRWGGSSRLPRCAHVCPAPHHRDPGRPLRPKGDNNDIDPTIKPREVVGKLSLRGGGAYSAGCTPRHGRLLGGGASPPAPERHPAPSATAAVRASARRPPVEAPAGLRRHRRHLHRVRRCLRARRARIRPATSPSRQDALHRKVSFGYHAKAPPAVCGTVTTGDPIFLVHRVPSTLITAWRRRAAALGSTMEASAHEPDRLESLSTGCSSATATAPRPRDPRHYPRCSR
jgi:hypothetical protein